MIISASRRTDIPAFYSDWFIDRITEGFVRVNNPVNPRQVTRVDLSPEAVDCLVFWTKNPVNLMAKLDKLAAYNYYFLFTLTPYDRDLEPNLPPKEKLIDTFIALAGRIGRHRVIWRYDPIILTDGLDSRFHEECFSGLARRLSPYTEKCIISFLDMYPKCKRRLADFHILMPGPDEMLALAEKLATIARRYDLSLETCAEELDFTPLGIAPAHCIDLDLINRLSGKNLSLPKDKHQRKTCGCAQSVDIGAYDTCRHGCLYCYANAGSPGSARGRDLFDGFSDSLFKTFI